jgi:hypothetical protein
LATVFISYSHENPSHKEKVLALSNRLRENGIDVTLDAYVQHPPEGWPKWMECQFQLDFVVVVLSKLYIMEFNQDVKSSSGARYEGAMLSARLCTHGLSYERIAIVCFNEWTELVLPLSLYGCTRYFVDKQGEYEKLYAFLSGQVLVPKPPLGNIVQLRPAMGTASEACPIDCEHTFHAMCRAIWPLMEENRRIFEDFGPNSGGEKPGEQHRSVRFDLSIWKLKRQYIGEINQRIAGILQTHMGVIPDAHKYLFRKWLSHIDAFALHLMNENIDYRDHQFPNEIINVVQGQL